MVWSTHSTLEEMAKWLICSRHCRLGPWPLPILTEPHARHTNLSRVTGHITVILKLWPSHIWFQEERSLQTWRRQHSDDLESEYLLTWNRLLSSKAGLGPTQKFPPQKSAPCLSNTWHLAYLPFIRILPGQGNSFSMRNGKCYPATWKEARGRKSIGRKSEKERERGRGRKLSLDVQPR